jgi:hypothetical protein
VADLRHTKVRLSDGPFGGGARVDGGHLDFRLPADVALISARHVRGGIIGGLWLVVKWERRAVEGVH